MKHLIILNGKAGEGSAAEKNEQIQSAFANLDAEFHFTAAPREATKFVDEYLKAHAKEQVRVYACGGDGTINEVANGLVGHDNGELAIYPIGTGNDFIKYYGGPERFLDIPKLVAAKSQPIDLSKIESDMLDEPVYSINVTNFGFDSVVGSYGNKFKLEGKKDPYKKAVNVALMKGRYNNIIVWADGEQLNKKKMLLCTLAQGNYVGGEYKCAPRSKNNDGLIDVCLLHCMPLLTLAAFMKPYTAGLHLDTLKYAKRIEYRQAKEIKIEAPKEIELCVDGEMYPGRKFTVSVVPGAIKLVIPE